MGRSAVLDRDQKAPLPQSGGPDWFESDPRWLVAQRVVASPHFVRSRLLAKFLLYIVAETIEDRKANITEHRIGVHVFDRPSSYSSVEDNIVRNYARQLRRRLADYFAEEGAAEPLQIDIPLGGYVPVFAPAAAHSAAAKPRARSLAIPIRLGEGGFPGRVAAAFAYFRLRARQWILAAPIFALYTVLLVVLTWFAAERRAAPHRQPSAAGPTAPLWSALFGGPANCYIVPADAGINLLGDLQHHPVPLVNYMKGAYLGVSLPQVDPHTANDLRSQEFTSFVDLQTVAALTRLPEFNPQRVLLRFPRDLQLDDLKNANAVILGAEGSDPWAALAESNANFRIVSNNNMLGDTLIDMKPRPGEAPTYVSHWSEPDHETFSVISYLPNLNGTGHLLLLQGLDVAGTQAAVETLLHPDVIAPILREAIRPDGSLRSFEILLRSTSLVSNATNTQVIGSRIY